MCNEKRIDFLMTIQFNLVGQNYGKTMNLFHIRAKLNPQLGHFLGV